MARELYVGNISNEATEDDLRKLFSVSGKVSSIHLITDPVSGKFKGCCYVKMGSDAEAKDAIESLDGALLLSRLLRVSESRPREQRTSGDRGKTGREDRKPRRDTGSRRGRK
ncbi:MAG: RNA-binding protein [Geobacter sp.]|nr:RNA-binding protein [Geobacter sp.]